MADEHVFFGAESANPRNPGRLGSFLRWFPDLTVVWVHGGVAGGGHEQTDSVPDREIPTNDGPNSNILCKVAV